MNFTETVTSARCILTEGGMLERLKRDPGISLDPHIAHAGLIYDENARKKLESIYKEYINIGRKFEIPFITLAPTWRANFQRVQQSSLSHHENINRDCVNFLKEIRRDYGKYADYVFIGGMMACKGDAYKPAEALAEAQAKTFHRQQAGLLAESGVDFIKAATLPALSEAAGIASAIAEYSIPYVISFVVRPDGSLLDGHPLHQAINIIDNNVDPAPLFYMVNCVHPSIFAQAMQHETAQSKNTMKRVRGLQANTSSKSPEDLDNLAYLDSSPPDAFADLMISLHNRFNVKILGGCCGSDARHIEAVAGRLR